MRLKHLTRAAAIAGAVTVPLTIGLTAGGLPEAQAAPGPAASAFGLSASGPVTLPPTPAVASTGAGTSRSVAELPANAVVRARVLNATAGKAHARASVADLAIPRAALKAGAVTAKCVQGKGVSNLAEVTLNGKPIKAAAAPNSALTVRLDGVGTVALVLNKQTRASDGRLTVTAIELTLPVGAGRNQVISVASATCGQAAPQPGPSQPGTPEKPEPSPSAPPSTSPPGAAPAPTPVPGDLPVTG
ncbi:choice-of-anchor P family protein [Actinomadura viridis]|uniref:choice-of-anchor P family protein n=1 Tax=Actinomadura viridis TaxID=58110 RepID=UPI003696BA07